MSSRWEEGVRIKEEEAKDLRARDLVELPPNEFLTMMNSECMC